MNINEILTTDILQAALLIMKKATVHGDQAYAYVQVCESFKAAIHVMQQPVAQEETTDGDNGEESDE